MRKKQTEEKPDPAAAPGPVGYALGLGDVRVDQFVTLPLYGQTGGTLTIPINTTIVVANLPSTDYCEVFPEGVDLPPNMRRVALRPDEVVAIWQKAQLEKWGS